MEKYQLNPGVYFFEGASRGALLDTNTGCVYSVNNDASLVIKGDSVDIDYWEKLVALKVAQKSNDIVQNQLQKQEVLSELKFAWFELNGDECNERCIHCYADSMPQILQKKKAVKETKKRMNYQDWLKAIQEAYYLGCKRCQFIGGEPFLYRSETGENVLDLAEYAKKCGYSSIEIFTNGTLLTGEKISRIKQLGLRIAISLYSSDPKIHDEITRTPNSHAKTLKNIQLLKEAEIPVRVETVLMKINQSNIDETLALKKQLGVQSKRPDPLRPKGRGDNPLLEPDFNYVIKYGLITEPDFVANIKKLEHYFSGHSCLLGKIAITEYGDILPCIFARNTIIGNITDKNLETIIISDKTKSVWGITKDSVLVCQDCEYRYLCFDCRPLSEGAAEGNVTFSNAPYPRCTYNPYTGEWAKGLWKASKDGKPFYDRSKAHLIQEYLETIKK